MESFLSLKEFVPYWLFRITSLIEIASIYCLQSALKRVAASPEATSWLLGPTTAAQVTIDDPYLPLFAIYDRSLSLTPFERRISPGCCISFRYCALEKVFTAPTYGSSFVEFFSPVYFNYLCNNKIYIRKNLRRMRIVGNEFRVRLFKPINILYKPIY